MILALHGSMNGLERGRSLGGELANALPLDGPSLAGGRLDFTLSSTGLSEFSVVYLRNTSRSTFVLSHFAVRAGTFRAADDELGLAAPGRSDRLRVLWAPVMTPNTAVSIDGGDLLTPFGLELRVLAATQDGAEALIPVDLGPGEFLPLILLTEVAPGARQTARYSAFLSVSYLTREAGTLTEGVAL